MTKTTRLPPRSPPSAPTSNFDPRTHPKQFWEAFLGAEISFTPFELCLYSRLDLDPFLVSLAQILCAQLTLPSLPGTNLATSIHQSLDIPDRHRALTDLQKISGKVASTDEGANLLLVIGVVCEYFTADALVSVFGDLAQRFRYPVDIVPSPEKWTALGRLSNSLDVHEFSALVDKFSALGVDEVHLSSELEHISGEDVAHLFSGMGQLHRREQEKLIVFMGKDAAWVAAVAEWVFGLKLALKGQDGGILYQSPGEGEVQLDVWYSKPGVPVDGEPVVCTPLAVRQRV